MNLLKRLILGTSVVVLVVLAVVTGAVRLAISNIEFFKPEIEYLLERDLTPGFVFTDLSGSMNRFNPILSIENVSITLPDRSQPLFIDRLTVEFDFWSSLRENAPVVYEISGQLERLELVKDAEGRWWTNEIALGGDDDSMTLPAFRQVLALLPRYLRLDLNRLLIRDQKTGVTHRLDRVEASIDHIRDQFFMLLSAELPEQLGRGLLLKSIVGPDRSLIYLNTDDLRLKPVAQLFDLDTHGLQEGSLDGEIWANMAEFKLLAVNGNLVLKDGLVQMTADKTPLPISYQTRFSAIGRSSGWRISSRFDRLQIAGQSVPGFKAQFELGDGSSPSRLNAWIDRLQVASLPAIAGQWLPARMNQQIADGRLKGLLHDVLLSIDLEQPEGLVVGARVSDLSSQRFDEFPGVQNVDASFVVSTDRIGVELQGQQVLLDFGDHFNAPLEFERLAVTANLDRIGDLLVIDIARAEAENRDIRADGRMWLEVDPGQPVFSFIRLNFADGVGASTSKYLPRKIMPQKTQQWLDTAIKSGFVPAGDLLFHGRMRDIRDLERERSGEFYVDFEVERADLFFSPGWLDARDASGRVLFHNAGMTFDMSRVSYDRIEGVQARGSIANFDNPRLDISIDAALLTERAVQTWIDTPVGKRYRQVMKNFSDLEGGVQSRINLSIPLAAEDDDLKVKVLVDFENASTNVDGWGLDLSQINGRLVVTENSIDAKSIDARFFGDPVTIAIETQQDGALTLVSARGMVESANLLRTLPLTIGQGVSGKSDWRVKLRLPDANIDSRQPFLYIDARSNLGGTAISLPAPFAKSAKTSRAIDAQLEFSSQQIRYDARLGDDVLARGRLLADGADGYRIEDLDLALATSLKQTPSEGLRIYGELAEVDLDAWLELSESFGKPQPGLLQTVDVRVGRAEIAERLIENVDLQINQFDQQLFGSIDSSHIKGNFQAPLEPAPGNPVVFELERLQIDKLDQKTDYSALRPQNLRDFRLNSKTLFYHDMRFNDLVVEARAGKNRFTVDRLDMRINQVAINGSARWDYDPSENAHVSTVSVKIRGDDFGEAIAGIGFGGTMSGGTVSFDGGFTWPAPIMGFQLDNFTGDAKLEIEDGVLNSVEPGSGRFVGLLSLSALPRRLSLDFSDVLIKGMEFDKIDGSYQISDGIIRTRNTRMDGPAAKIKISGKTNIVERDYDQQISVVPKIRQTLPLIGAVSAGSTVGWGLLLLQNLFKKAIDDAVEIEYRVTGSWDDPRIELIKAVDENQQELPEVEDTDR